VSDETPTLDAEKLQAELDEIEARRTARRKAPVDAAVLALRVADAKALDGAEEKYGEGSVAHYDTGEGIVVVRAPDPLRYRKYLGVVGRLTQVNSDESNAKITDEAHSLVLAVLVHPSKARFDEIAEKFPGVPSMVAGLVSDLAAGRTRRTSEK
jgi:hypothetical protein